MSRLADDATQWAFAAGWSVVRSLPERAAYGAFAAAADGLWRRRAGDVQQLERNLARVYPTAGSAELRDLSRVAMRSYLRYWCDAFRMPSWPHERIRDTFEMRGVEVLDRCVAEGRGAIVVPNHGGNWDHAGAWAALRYGTLSTVVERLRPERLYERFLAYRRSLGMEIFPLGEPGLVRTLARRLGEGRVVPLLGDRDLSGTGVLVDLLGHPAHLPAGPAALALLSGAPLIPAVGWYESDRAVTQLYPPIGVPSGGTRAERVQAMTQEVASVLGHGLREHGVHWHMLQPVWQADVRTTAAGAPRGAAR